ncbi:MAG: hypothetical protein OEY28_11375 [Nitrospira sp.]|nr:hypothetical protein [Nitrospira sp.]
MGVFSKTMLMLTIAWLVGLNVTFFFLNGDPDASWREKFLAEANTRRAIAYRYVAIKGGLVGERGHGHGNPKNAANQKMEAESLGRAPGASASTDPLPGAKIAGDFSLIGKETELGESTTKAFAAAIGGVNTDNNNLLDEITRLDRERRGHNDKFARMSDEIKQFGAQMKAYQYTIAVAQQKVFNLDYEIQRIIVERDALAAELAQVENDIDRIKGQQIAQEDVLYDLYRRFEHTVRVLALYEQLDPNLRTMADTAGRDWLRGRVVAVGDDPRTGVVTISIGSEDGVEENQVFTVYRRGRFLARMRVESMTEDSATGTLLPEFRGRVAVLENDGVKASKAFASRVLR